MVRVPVLPVFLLLSASGGLLSYLWPETWSASPESAHQELFGEYCYRCHSSTVPQGGINLRQLDLKKLDVDGQIWEKVMRKLRTGEMPPAGRWRPDPAANKALIKYIEDTRDKLAETKPNPGRVTLHRLNRTEYGNVIRDLFSIEINAAELLPADDIGYGFDNIGDVLNLSPILLDRYLVAAEKISRLAIGDISIEPSFNTYEVPHGLVQIERLSQEIPLGSRGGATFQHYFPVDAEYDVAVMLQRGRFDGVMGMERDRDLDVRIDSARIKLFHIPSDTAAGGLGLKNDPNSLLKIRIPVEAGEHKITATFLKDTILPEGVPPRQVERAFYEGVGSISVAGPYNVTGHGTTESRSRIFVCNPGQGRTSEECAEKVISNFARAAYRRSVHTEDLKQLLTLYHQGAETGGFEGGIRLALQKILVSPEFIFRMEFDPVGATPGQTYKIDYFEMASRLSFFLWSSIPDEELLSHAEKGDLFDSMVLEAQVRRMLADKRSRALLSNFGGQWLFLRNMARIQPDPQAFPSFDENLRHSLAEETELVLETMLREDRSIVDLLDNDFTFINQRLARHYGIDGVYGTALRRVAITDPRRRGLLGQGSILAVTSYPNRTAPTIRGKWVMEQILGSPPPPPPADVPSLKDDATTRNMNMRERMEQHRANPSCAVCHRTMDPLGFALENFDGLGRWRDTVGGITIDASSVLPDGSKFDGPQGLRKVLLERKDQFIDTFTERLMTYALGRGVEEYDQPAIRRVTKAAADKGYSWSSIVLGIARSTPFQMRRASDDNL